MKKANVLEQVTTPDGSIQVLAERDGHYMLWVNGRELMSTRHTFSEEQLGVVGCEPLRDRAGVRVLIGGLGLGFTLRAALENLGPDAEVVVSELIPEVVEWNRNTAYPLASDALANRRTKIVIGDVAELIAKSAKRFDVILLDADNETTAMNTPGNSSLYKKSGLASIARALKPAGSVIYWSAAEDPLLVKRLRQANFQVETRRVRKHPTAKGVGYHVLLLARSPR
jgi:spermidine synthase